MKPENIVFCIDPVSGIETVKITDFGLSNQSEAEETMMSTYCGSMLYSSPEVLLMEPYVVVLHALRTVRCARCHDD